MNVTSTATLLLLFSLNLFCGCQYGTWYQMSKDVASRVVPDFMEMSMVKAKLIPFLGLRYSGVL